ncbi:AzlD domain-containing protein [Alicyclobacillus sp. SO9]|uniref:AzlD domain-containing protein n=1 Tax=Alicyclobacillus sp. SO9 TaxID=2665646 RepID=UPI0018E7EA5D|nr:AzlD domain-containing protein [Alicyclobacillus sp. SO9]QQE78032.1 AzlD domain-containing protein [Alicyclobacillus sp. SO9]
MTSLQINLTIAAVALATYLTRFPSVLIGRHLKVTPRLKQGLYYIPIGVFSGMIAPALYNGIFAAGGNHFAFAAASVLAIFIAIRTKSPLWAMLTGMSVLALLRWWM